MPILRSTSLPRLAVLTTAIAVAPVLLGTTAISFGSSADTGTTRSVIGATADLVGPDGVPVLRREVEGDMIVDWLDETSTATPDHGHGAHDGAGDGGEEGSGVSAYEAASGRGGGTGGRPGEGFALMSASARWLPGGYTIRLTGSDARVEQYRDELAAAASAAASAAGRPVRVDPRSGGSSTPRTGEITVVIGDGPCGAGAMGCGGPAVRNAQIVSGRIWIGASALRAGAADRANLAAHELGHTLGLSHYSAAWTDGRQTMHPQVSGVSSYRDGDRRGLRFAAGHSDQPAGSITQAGYAGGRVVVSGVVSSGSRVRITAGSAASEVRAASGRFSGAVAAGAGSHRVCVTSLDAAPGFRRDLGCSQVTAPGAPFGALDAVDGSFRTVHVAGWAIDPQTAGPVDVQIRRNGKLVATTPARSARADVAERQPSYGADHGFDLEIPAVPGTNDVCVRIVGVGAGGNTDLGCRRVSHAVDPVGAFQATANDLGVRVHGWALDPNTPNAVDVRAVVDGSDQPLGTFSASQSRPGGFRDHPAHGDNHGFSHQLALMPGRHEVCLTVVNVGLGQDRPLGCAAVEVQSAPAIGKVVTSLGSAAGAAPVAGSVTELVTGVLGGGR